MLCVFTCNLVSAICVGISIFFVFVGSLGIGHFSDCRQNQYMGFGLSGNPKETYMVGSDVTIAWLDNQNGQPNAVDYFINGRAQVRREEGRNIRRSSTFHRWIILKPFVERVFEKEGTIELTLLFEVRATTSKSVPFGRSLWFMTNGHDVELLQNYVVA